MRAFAIAAFRIDAVRAGEPPEAMALAAELMAASADFRRLWSENAARRHALRKSACCTPLENPLKGRGAPSARLLAVMTRLAGSRHAPAAHFACITNFHAVNGHCDDLCTIYGVVLGLTDARTGFEEPPEPAV